MVQLVTDSGVRFWCPILVSNSNILASDPDNPVIDPEILVSDS